MRHDLETKRKLMVNIGETKQIYIRIFDKYIKELNLARSAEGIMKAKQKFLVDLSCALPTNSGDCYFCLLYSVNCNLCEYVKHHGRCCYNSNSDFAKLRLAKQELIDVLRKSYYKGEKYNEA